MISCSHHIVFDAWPDHETKLTRGVCKLCGHEEYLPFQFSQKVIVQTLSRKRLEKTNHSTTHSE